MAKRKTKIKHASIVLGFAARLKELRLARNLTQAELARQAQIALSHFSKLESGDASPGLDLLDRLAEALGIAVTELIPVVEDSKALSGLQERARQLFEAIMKRADSETLRVLNPLLARFS